MAPQNVKIYQKIFDNCKKFCMYQITFSSWRGSQSFFEKLFFLKNRGYNVVYGKNPFFPNFDFEMSKSRFWQNVENDFSPFRLDPEPGRFWPQLKGTAPSNSLSNKKKILKIGLSVRDLCVTQTKRGKDELGFDREKLGQNVGATKDHFFCADIKIRNLILY